MASDVFGILRPADNSGPKTVIVLGAPRGGTSMVAATLRKLGVMMGENLGHQHEDRKFRGDVPVEEMIETIKERNATQSLWGWKLPNSVYYLEKLMPHVRNPHLVAIFRNPFSISRSSAERDKREYDAKLLQVAVNHSKKVVDLIATIEVPTALAAFEAVMANREEFVRGLAGFINVTAEDAIQEALRTGINKELGYIRF